MSLFNIGLSGLSAAQSGLLTAGHNISNAATPGYTRQETVQTTRIPVQTGSGFFGTGVQVDTVRRIYSQFLANQVVSSQSRSSELDTYYARLKQVDDLLADPSAGLSPALQAFFSALQDVATHPSNSASRQALLSAAAALDSRFELIDGRLSELRSAVNDEISTTVDTINAYARDIANLNQAVILAKNSAGGQPPNDLLDQRDQKILELNTLIRTSVVPQDDGALNVFIGNGQPLVTGIQVYSLAAVRDAQDSSRMTVGYRTAAGVTQLPESMLAGGSLGAILAFRAQALDATQNALGRVAIVLADTFNAQHRLGQDLYGALGGDFFSLGTPSVIANSRNTGNGVISAVFDDTRLLTTSDYRLSYDGTNYTMTRLADGAQTTFAGLPITFEGFQLQLASGAIAAGDSFVIQPTRSGATDLSIAISDPALVAAAEPVRSTQSSANTGTGSVSALFVNPGGTLDPNLQQPVTITFTSATTFDVSGPGTGNPTGQPYTPGADITYNGWTLQIGGAPAAGDSFSVGPNTNGIGDNRNALALAALQTQNLVANSSASYQTAYAAIVGEVGSRTRELEITAKAESVLLSQHVTARESLSGVNLDEEAANLVRYQQAYQASGKVLQIAAELFDTILALGK